MKMSAITGIFYRNGRNVDLELIKKMNCHLAHRGPDGSAVWCGENVALGHQMLWTTPESLHEKLPFHDEKTGLVITADARIDNRKELSKELNIKNVENVSDSYFILKSYEKWGEKCPEKLLGDFAFAIWDGNNEKLFCARDHMGVKPFYYYLSDEYFFFATEINTLKLIQEVPRQLNELRVADYLIHLVEDREITFYKGIHRLPAAHYFIINYNEANKICYWKLDPSKETIMESDKEYAHEFLQIFTEAVECRLRSIFPVGSLLSGGLDSSSITCTARKILVEQNSNQHLKTFSALFKSVSVCDEQDYIQTVLDGGNLESHLLETDGLSPLSQINTVLEKVGEPFNIPNYYIHWEIFRKAQQENVRILLDGFDGDSTVFYEERYALDIAREMRLKKLFTETKCMAKKYGLSQTQMFLYAVVLPLIPEWIQRSILQNLINLLNINVQLTEGEFFDIIKEEFVLQTNLKSRFKSLYKDPLKRANTNKLRHNLRLSSPYLQYAMEILDIFSANFNIENRYPFFDRRLVEFCLSLPKEQKYSKMWDRIIMRRAMEGILPEKIQWRVSKTGMGMHFRKNMFKFDQKIIENSIFNNSRIISNYADLKKLKAAYAEFEKGVKGISQVDIWLCVLLIIWLNNYSFHELN